MDKETLSCCFSVGFIDQFCQLDNNNIIIIIIIIVIIIIIIL